MKRFLSLLLAGALLLCLFAGCDGKSGTDASPSPDTSPTASPEPTPLEKLDIADNTLIMTVGGSPVYWDEFRYWMYSSLQYLGYSTDEDIDWNEVNAAGETLGEYIVNDAAEAVRLYRTIEAKCAELGIELTTEDLDAIESTRASNIEYYGSEADYLAHLESIYLTEDLLNYMLSVSSLYYRLFIELYGENAEKLSDEDAIAFGEANNYYRAKHILLSATDELGEPRSEEEYAALRVKLEGFLEELNASEDPVALFDELMNNNSEDGGLAGYPNGYQFVEGDMVEEFQTAVEALEDYAYSDIVEMSYGWTIIMRLPLDPDEIAVSDYYGYTLRYNAATSTFQTLAATWSQEQEVVYEPIFETIDPARVFIISTAQPSPTTSPTASPTTTPTASPTATPAE